MQCFHCIISGKVQGVWFRATTQEKALALGLCGWVKNTPNGKVEVYACGEEKDLAELKQWLKQGPPLARVTGIDYLPAELQDCQGFEVK